MNLFYYFEDIMNFTCTITKPRDSSFGNLKEDGSWTGMVGNLKNHEVDIGVTLEIFQKLLCWWFTHLFVFQL